ncbi:hypothetical protein N9W84_01085 [bacterium]|nr:hypothetical protein [bacterium]
MSLENIFFDAGGYMEEIARTIDVEALKEQWVKDPIWDIEDTEGYEDFREELISFRIKMKKIWHRNFIEMEEKRKNKNYDFFNEKFSDSVGYSDRFLLAQVYKNLIEKIEELEDRVKELENL